MAKKKKRYSTPNIPENTRVSRASQTRGKEVDLSADYAYVMADLGRIALIAAVILGALVALWFFLP